MLIFLKFHKCILTYETAAVVVRHRANNENIIRKKDTCVRMAPLETAQNDYLFSMAQ